MEAWKTVWGTSHQFLTGIIFQYTVNFDFFFPFTYLCVGVESGGTHAHHSTHVEVQGQLLGASSSTLWVSGVPFESSGLVASTVTHGTVWPALVISFHFTDEETTVPPSSRVHLYSCVLDPLTGSVKGEFDRYFPETVERFQVSINNS